MNLRPQGCGRARHKLTGDSVGSVICCIMCIVMALPHAQHVARGTVVAACRGVRSARKARRVDRLPPSAWVGGKS